MSSKPSSFFVKIFFVVGLFFAFPLSVRATTLGVSPSQMDLGFVRADNVIKQNLTVMFYNENEDYSGESKLKVELDGIGKEAVQLESDTIVFKDKETKKDFNFTVNPKNLLPGKYQIKFIFYQVLNSEVGGDNSLKVKVSAVVNFELTTKLVLDVDAFVGSVVVHSSPGNQAKFDLYLKNLGNTKESVDTVKVMMSSDTDKINHEFIYIPSSTVKLNPKSTIFFPTIFTIPVNLSLGNYRADFSYYSQGRVIKEYKDVDIRVEAPRLMKKSFKLYYLAVSFLSFIFLILLIKFFKK